MATRKISAATALTGANVATGDLVPIVDISDPTDNALSGTTKKITAAEFRSALQPQSSGTAVRHVSASFSGMVAPFYTTISDAITGSSSGDLVLIYPGTYSERVVLKDGVNLFMYPGAKVSYDGASSAFTDNSVDVSCVVDGFGIIERGSTGGIGRTCIGVSSADSNIVIRARKIVGLNNQNCISNSGGTLTIVADIDTSSSSGSQPISVTGGTLTVYGNITSGTSAALSINSGSVVLYGDISSAATDGAVVRPSGGTVKLFGSRIRSTGENANSHGVSVSGGIVILSHCHIVTTHASSNSLHAGDPQNVKVYSPVVANKDKHANITIQVGTFVFDANVE